MAFYHHIVRDAHGALLCSGLRAGSRRRLTIDSRSPPRPPISPADGRHPLAPPPRRSWHQVEACCTARIARATWHTDKASTLIGANRSAPEVPERACGTSAALGQSLKFGARRFISRGSERDDSAGRTCLARCKVRPLPAMTVGSCGGWGPMGVLDSGDDASLQGDAPPCTAGSIKDVSRSCPG